MQQQCWWAHPQRWADPGFQNATPTAAVLAAGVATELEQHRSALPEEGGEEPGVAKLRIWLIPAQNRGLAGPFLLGATKHGVVPLVCKGLVLPLLTKPTQTAFIVFWACPLVCC